jgi:hypothetical protein
MRQRIVPHPENVQSAFPRSPRLLTTHHHFAVDISDVLHALGRRGRLCHEQGAASVYIIAMLIVVNNDVPRGQEVVQ